jgi:RimJ/RimL family protein N-acetyltransferase
MTFGPVLFTERLMLRVPNASDLDGFAEMEADADSMRYLGGIKTRSEAWRSMASITGAWLINGYSMFSVIERESGRWVGRLGPWQPEGWPGPEVGYGMHPAFAGKGYAYEATVAAMDYAFDVLGWDDVCHTIDPENTRSIALAQRLGSTNRGPTQLPAPFETVRVDNWGQSATAWRARHGAVG